MSVRKVSTPIQQVGTQRRAPVVSPKYAAIKHPEGGSVENSRPAAGPKPTVVPPQASQAPRPSRSSRPAAERATKVVGSRLDVSG